MVKKPRKGRKKNTTPENVGGKKNTKKKRNRKLIWQI